MRAPTTAERFAQRRAARKGETFELAPISHRPPVTQPDAFELPEKLMRPQTRLLARRFLDAYTKHPMNKKKACDMVGISPSTVKCWMKEYEWFRLAVIEMENTFIEAAEAELYRRAVDGWDEEVYGKDGFVGTVRKYDGKLLERLVASRKPEYRQNHNPDGVGAGVQLGVIVVNNVAEDMGDFEKMCANAIEVQRENKRRVLDGRKTDG